ncbi:hypothetical protein ACFLXA_01245 [Chloroflexota bacterium]
MEELKDYSGPLKDDLRLEDFSKEFIIKLAKEWQNRYPLQEELWVEMIKDRFGQEVADEMEMIFNTKMAELSLPRMAKLANIQVKDMVDVMKVFQLIVEGLMAFQPDSTYEIINRNHVIWTAKRCLNLEYFEKVDPARVQSFCHEKEGRYFELYTSIFLPNCEVTALKLPPRKSREEIACQWELKIKT